MTGGEQPTLALHKDLPAVLQTASADCYFASGGWV